MAYLCCTMRVDMSNRRPAAAAVSGRSHTIQVSPIISGTFSLRAVNQLQDYYYFVQAAWPCFSHSTSCSTVAPCLKSPVGCVWLKLPSIFAPWWIICQRWIPSAINPSTRHLRRMQFPPVFASLWLPAEEGTPHWEDRASPPTAARANPSINDSMTQMTRFKVWNRRCKLAPCAVLITAEQVERKCRIVKAVLSLKAPDTKWNFLLGNVILHELRFHYSEKT